jgi:hypothetical protein
VSVLDDVRKAPPPNGQELPTGRKPTIQELIARQLGAVEACNHEELLSMDLPEPSWLVKDLVIDEGLTLLGGKKKLGKSWLCLQIAQAVATGATCLGRAVTQGSVLYICLEDGRRRLRSRLLRQHTSQVLPIKWVTRFPPLDGDGLGLLMDEMAEWKPRLVIIDTLAAAKTGKIDENAAGSMADLGNALRGLAQIYKAGIFATHHHGKLTGGDPGDDLRGSSALAAAGDVNLGLYREAAGHLIRGEGRDVGEFTLPLAFDPVNTWAWQLRENPRAGAVNSQRREQADEAVLEALRSLGEATAAEVAQQLGLSRSAISQRLARLFSQGLISSRVAAMPSGQRSTLYSTPDAPLPD